MEANSVYADEMITCAEEIIARDQLRMDCIVNALECLRHNKLELCAAILERLVAIEQHEQTKALEVVAKWKLNGVEHA